MNRTLVTLLAAGMLASPTAAQMSDIDMFQTANALGTIIGSETFCGLSYDQDAVAAYIASIVPPDRMDFASVLSAMVQGQGFNNQSLRGSAKTAHCASVDQTARHYGFIE